MQNKFKKLLIFIFLSLGGQALTFLVGVLLSHRLTIEEFGVFNLCMSVVNLGATMTYVWNSSITYYCGSKEIAEKGTMQQTNLIRLIFITAAYILLFITIILFKNKINKYLGGSYSIIIYFIIISKGIADFTIGYLITKEKKNVSAISLIIVEFMAIVTLVIFKVNIEFALRLQLIYSCLLILLVIYGNREDFSLKKIDSVFLKYCTNFALWQMIGSFSVYIISYSDNFLIAEYLSVDDIAYYNVAYRIFLAVFMAANILANYNISNITKAITEKNKDELKKIFCDERVKIFCVIVVIHIGLIIFAKEIIYILYGARYLKTVNIFRILMVSSIFRYWVVYEVMYLNVTGQFKIQQLLNVVSATLKVILGFIFIQKYNILGLAISMAISSFIVCLISIYICEPKIKKLYKEEKY